MTLMTPQAIEFYPGEDLQLTFSPDALPAADVALWTVGFYLWRASDPGAQAPAVAKTSGAGVAVADAAARTFTVTLGSADTARLAAPARYRWEFWRLEAGGRRVLAVGSAEVGRAKHTFG